MIDIKGFTTLKAKQIKGRYFIYSTQDQTTIGPKGFDTLEALEAYANEKYYNDYV